VFTLLSFKALACNVLLLFSLLFPKEEITTPFLLLLFVLVFFVLLLLLHLLLLAFNCLLFATIAPFRGHRSTFIVIIILYIFVLFIIAFRRCLWGSKISLFLSFSFKQNRQKHTTRDHHPIR